MQPDFIPAIALELTFEGGYSNQAKDPGGPTNYGITIPALSQFRGRPCTAADVQNLQVAEAEAIYRAMYWTAIAGDQIYPGVDLICLNAAINLGRGRAAQFMQEIAGVVVDRNIGPASVQAIMAIAPGQFVVDMQAKCSSWYQALPTFATFGNGWMRRLNTITATATAWAINGGPSA